MTILIIAGYLAISIFVIVDVKEIASGGTSAIIAGLSGIYVYSVLGTIANLVIFVRSFSTSARRQKPQSQVVSTSSKSFGHSARLSPLPVKEKVVTVGGTELSGVTTFELVYIPEQRREAKDNESV